MCSGSEAGLFLRLIDSCITQSKAEGLCWIGERANEPSPPLSLAPRARNLLSLSRLSLALSPRLPNPRYRARSKQLNSVERPLSAKCLKPKPRIGPCLSSICHIRSTMKGGGRVNRVGDRGAREVGGAGFGVSRDPIETG